MTKILLTLLALVGTLGIVPGISFTPPVSAETFKLALHPHPFKFPHDHGKHPAYKTEWWYLTGVLRSAGGRRWGYQFTLFRNGLIPPGNARRNPWQVSNLFLLHAAISDMKNRKFYHYSDLARKGPGICGAETGDLNVWMKTAHLRREDKDWILNFKGPRFSYHLTLIPSLPPVLHGDHGLSRKGTHPGQATYYYSVPGLKTCGTLETPEGRIQVDGTSWFDHEFGTNQLAKDQAGWDWFALHLSNGSYLMVYQIRKVDGAREPTSSATYIPTDGRPTRLSTSQFRLTPRGGGKRVLTGISYPLYWILSIPSLKLELDLSPQMEGQVWPTKDGKGIPYWEGAIDVKGKIGNTPLTGKGYMELTGYGKRLRWDE